MHRTIGWSTWCAPEVSRERSVMRPGCTTQSRAAYLKLAESLPKHLNRGADLTRAFARRSRLHAKPRPSSPPAFRPLLDASPHTASDDEVKSNSRTVSAGMTNVPLLSAP